MNMRGAHLLEELCYQIRESPSKLDDANMDLEISSGRLSQEVCSDMDRVLVGCSRLKLYHGFNQQGKDISYNIYMSVFK